MWKRITYAGMLLVATAFLRTEAMAQSIPMSQINAPNGIAGLDATASVTAPVKGTVDNATVGGTPLSIIIPALEQQQRLSDSIPKSWIGIDNGVAGLDATGGINLGSGTFESTYQGNTGLNVTVPIFSIGTSAAITSYTTSVGGEAILFGGMASSDSGYTSSVNLSVKGQPSGYMNEGCSLCVLAANGSWSSGNVKISSSDPTQGASSLLTDNGYGVGVYEYSENYAARLSAQAIQFTSTTVTLAANMSASVKNNLHAGMYVATNVTVPGTSTTDASGLPQEYTYWGILKSWTTNTLTVYGWGPLGSLTGAAPVAVPDPTKLETVKSAYSVPMVFVGTPARTVGNYTYGNMQGNLLFGAGTSSRSNRYDGSIIDINASNFHNGSTLQIRGQTVKFTCTSCAASPLNSNSYGYGVEGLIPYGFVSHVGATAAGNIEYFGDSTYIPGPFMSTGITSSNQHIMSSTAAELTGNTSASNILYMATTVVPTISTPASMADYTVLMGPNLGGTRSKDLLTGGTLFPSIGWSSTAGANGRYTSMCFNNTAQVPEMCIQDGVNGTVGSSSILFSAQTQFAKSIDMLANDVTDTTAFDALSLSSYSGTGFNVKARYTAGVDELGNPAAGVIGYSAASAGAAGNTVIDFGFGTYSSSSHGTNPLSSLSPVMSIHSDSVQTYMPVQVNGKIGATISNVQDWKSPAITSVITGDTGGSASGDYSVGLFAEERVGNWTSAILRFNGYHGILDWRFNEDGTIITPAGKVIADSSTLGTEFLLANGGQSYGEMHLSNNGVASFVDPDSGVGRDAKFGNLGIAVHGGTKTDTLTITGDTVDANYAYASLPSSPTIAERVYCSDCYSTMRDATNPYTGMDVTWNGHAWVDGIGNPVVH